jgi:hypothetical protein
MVAPDGTSERRREDMKFSSASHYRRRPMTHAVAVHAATVQPARIA